MTLRRFLLAIASLALAVLLIALLIKVSKIDLRVTARQLESVSLLSFTKIVLLNVLLVYFSSEKWRSIDAAWRRSTDSAPSRMTSFTLTSAGLALGMLLPVQLAMATARTLGTYVHGRPLKRGTAGTLIEQGFDLLTVGFLAIASWATWLYHGGGTMWTLLAISMTAIAFLVVGPAIHAIRWLSAFYNSRGATPGNRIFRTFGELQHSAALNARLASRLVMLSVGRFCVVVLISIETANAIGLQIPLWQMAATIPVVIFASVIALTPGGIGINELAGVGALTIFGTPMAVATQWALANRVLVAASYFFVAICAALVLGARKLIAASRRDAISDRPR